jgi:hypothetical protein
MPKLATNPAAKLRSITTDIHPVSYRRLARGLETFKVSAILAFALRKHSTSRTDDFMLYMWKKMRELYSIR